jgi:membrane-associated phospholipid phosphatase
MRHRRVGRTGPNISAICDPVRRCGTFGGLFLILLAVAPLHYQGQVPQDRLAGASETQSGAECERPISLKQLPSNILHDQKPIWLFPVQVAKGKHLKPVVAVTLATVGLVALDPSVGGYFRNSPRYANWPNGFFSGLNMALATAIPPAAVYAVGLARKDTYAQGTSLLALEAVADSELVSVVMKSVTGRLRPSDIPPHGDFTHTWFKYPSTFGNSGSFPSGHAIAAFSVASVFACRYGRRRWVPWVAYGGATVIALSRIPVQAHFPSDVFVGSTLGYIIGHYVAMRR